jgi:heat shock protein HtpX
MWQAIRDNTRRSRQVILLMAVLLLGLGALVGRILFGVGGSGLGIVGATAIWAILLAIAFLGGERLVVWTSGAREIGKGDAPQLWNVVEEMTIAAGLRAMPRVCVLDSYMQNAFAVGRSEESARLIVTEGLIRGLTRDELQGVVAHEIGHIKNQDVRFMTLASVMLGSVTLLADTCRRVLWFGGGRRSRLRTSPQIYMVLMALALLAAILAPLCARLLYLACSREREFLADASAARFTRYPEGLASALGKISRRKGVTREDALRTLAPMYIINPLASAASSAGLFRTHPPTEERIQILRSMSGSGWADYERAYQRVHGADAQCLDPRLVASDGFAPIRPPEAGDLDMSLEQEVAGVLDRKASLLAIPCPCGLTIKVPGSFPRTRIDCPRCGRGHTVPQPEADVSVDSDRRGLVYHRRRDGWETFRCSCGRVTQLSPALRVASVRCKGCRQKIRVLSRTA